MDMGTLFTNKNGIYLLNHSVGCMPVSARDVAALSFFDAWEHGTPDSWGRWFPVFDQFKQRLAALFNAQAHQFCPQQNVSSGVSKLISSFPAVNENSKRNVILLTENDFPSVGFVMQQAKQLGYQIEFIGRDENVLDITTWERHLNERVHVVLITHGHYNTARLVPVKQVVEQARRFGVMSIVDIAQTAGVIPIDFSLWQADVVVGSCVKWLCGGPGAGFMWIADHLVQQLEPVDIGWFSHQDPFEFDIHHFEYANSALRFWGGTPSVLPYAIASNSIDLINKIGVEHIRRHNVELTSTLVDALPSSWLVSPSDHAYRTGTLVINPPNRELAEANLRQRNVHFDIRKHGFRLSPHIYNTAEQIEQVRLALNN